MDWDKLVNKVSTKGDMATVLIFGTVGFAVDALSSLHGMISPGYFAGLAASGALGAKNAMEAAWASHAKKQSLKDRHDSTIRRAEILVQELGSEGFLSTQQNKLQRDLALLDKGLITIEELEATITECLDAYRQ
jgi:hypothetical protein